MTTLDDAFKAIQVISKFVGPLIAAAPALEEAGSIDNYKQKLKLDIVALNKEKENVRNSIDELSKSLITVKGDHDTKVKISYGELERNKAAAHTYIVGKQEEADKLINHANDQASLIIEQANNRANELIEVTNTNLSDKINQLKAADERLASVQASIAQRNKDLRTIEQTLDKYRK